MQKQTQLLVLFFTLAYGISWLIWGIGFSSLGKPTLESSMMIMLLGSFGPSLAALWLTYWQEGWLGTKALLQKLVLLRRHWFFYVFIFYVFSAVILGVLLLGGFRSSQPLENWALAWVVMPLNALLTALFSPGPLGEELGWRGYALPRMQVLIGQGSSLVVLGLLWTFWHLPIALYLPEWREAVPNLSLSEWLLTYPVSVVLLSVLLGIVYQRSQSVGLCVLLHGTVNYVLGQWMGKMQTSLSPLGAMTVVLLGLGLVTAMAWWWLPKQAVVTKQTT